MGRIDIAGSLALVIQGRAQVVATSRPLRVYAQIYSIGAHLYQLAFSGLWRQRPQTRDDGLLFQVGPWVIFSTIRVPCQGGLPEYWGAAILLCSGAAACCRGVCGRLVAWRGDVMRWLAPAVTLNESKPVRSWLLVP